MADTYISLRRLQYFWEGIKNKFATKDDIPTSTSELTNDSNFVQGAYIVDLNNPSVEIFNATQQAYNSGRLVLGRYQLGILLPLIGVIGAQDEITVFQFGFMVNGQSILCDFSSNGTTNITDILYDSNFDGVIDKAETDSSGNKFEDTYALKTEIPTDYITDAGVTSFNGESGAITYTAPVTSVNGNTGAVNITASDLGALTEHQSLNGYATETWVENKGYLTEHQSLENYATKSEIPTNISSFNNDAGYITSYTETDPVFSASSASSITAEDISNWNSKTSNTGTITGITTSAGKHTTVNQTSGSVSFNVPTSTSHLTNDSGFVTKNTTYELSMASNVITLTDSDGNTSTVTLPVYNGGVTT